MNVTRYVGGKGQAIDLLKGFLPLRFGEIRDPFCGGGSLMLNCVPLHLCRWMNDIDPNLMAFWAAVQADPVGFRDRMRTVAALGDLKATFARLLGDDDYSDPAVRWYFLHRTCYNGWTRLRRRRCNFSNPSGLNVLTGDRLLEVSRALRGVRLTCGDFAPLFDTPGNGVLILADPPYWCDTEASSSAKHYDYGFAPPVPPPARRDGPSLRAQGAALLRRP